MIHFPAGYFFFFLFKLLVLRSSDLGSGAVGLLDLRSGYMYEFEKFSIWEFGS